MIVTLARPVNIKTAKVKQHAKIVTLILIQTYQEKHPKQIVFGVPTTNQQVLRKETQMLPPAFVKGQSSTKMPQQTNVKFARMVPIALITTV